MTSRARLPAVIHKPPLLSKTDELIARSAKSLAFTHSALWRHEAISDLDLVDLVTIDRLGGQPGYSGSQIYVAALHARKATGRRLVSQPLLLKVIEDKPEIASKLIDELYRYERIKRHLPTRAHAQPLATFPAGRATAATRLLWSDFVGDTILGGLPFQAPVELRHVLERNEWAAASESLTAAYRIMEHAHRGHTEAICYYHHYLPYLRLEKGWCARLSAVVGDADTLNVMGRRVANPLRTLERIEKNPEITNGTAHVSCVHGDFHPKNILVGDVLKACLIDFGWAETQFNTLVDFVFMEASVKFFRLPWHVSRIDLLRFEDHLAGNYIEPIRLNDGILQNALDLIQVIRREADRYIDKTQRNWFSRQYLVPLFFVTIGLFPYALSVSNLGHLLLSAGLLAEHIEAELTGSGRSRTGKLHKISSSPGEPAC